MGCGRMRLHARSLALLLPLLLSLCTPVVDGQSLRAGALTWRALGDGEVAFVFTAMVCVSPWTLHRIRVARCACEFGVDILGSRQCRASHGEMSWRVEDEVGKEEEGGGREMLKCACISGLLRWQLSTCHIHRQAPSPKSPF